MDWMRRQDIKEESPETPTALTPDEPDESYFEEDTSIDEGMVRDSRGYCHLHYRSFRVKLRIILFVNFNLEIILLQF